VKAKLMPGSKMLQSGRVAASGPIPQSDLPWDPADRLKISDTIRGAEAVTSRKAAPAKNPRLGDTGVLPTGYDPASRTGYLGTGLFGLSQGPDPDMVSFAVDFSYFYKEDERLKRTGSFVFTLISDAPKAVFDRESSVVLYGGGSPLMIPAGKRLVRNLNGHVVEKMYYRMDRSVLQRIVNNNSAFLKIHNHVLVMTGARYLLYTMLQVTGG